MNTKSEYEETYEKVVYALETGNAGRAREILASSELSSGQLAMIRYMAMREYNIYL